MAIVFSITYKKNDGSSTELVCESGSKHVVDEITLVGQHWGETPQNWSRDGYTFEHWNTAADDSGTSYNGGDLYTGASVTLYAIWQADTPVGADVSVTLGNTEIASLSNTGSVTLATAGTYVNEDITVDYTKSGGTPTLQSKTVSPSTSQQTVSPDTGYDGLSSVTVNAMPSGTAGTPTATKGTVSNHSVSVTPSVTNTTGYITGGTINGTAVTITAAELESGTKSITENGTGIDVSGYSAVDVNVSGGGGGSSWTRLIASTEVNVNTTSTAVATVTTLDVGSSAYTKDKILWVHVRDKAGPRSGYFYGSDAFFINTNKANNATNVFNSPCGWTCKYSGTSYSSATGQYGVYGSQISSGGILTIRSRYNSSTTSTINGTYIIDVYLLELPSGLTLFG
jgi:uncharacterized repeat protein (TIGR02543 family)